MMTEQCAGKNMVLALLRMILLGLLSAFVSVGSNCMGAEVTAKAVTIPNGGLEDDGRGWRFELGYGRLNSLEWFAEGAHEGKMCAKLTYSGKEWLWLNTPPLLDLEPKKEVTLAFHAKWLSGGNVLSVGCNSLNRADKSWGDAHDDLWVGELPKENRWHEMEITFTTPEFDFKKRFLCIKMGPCEEACALLIDDVRIVSVVEPRPEPIEPADSSRLGEVKFDIPDELPLGDFPEVQEETKEGRRWRRVTLGDVLVQAPAEIEPRLGFHEAFPLVLENRAGGEIPVEIAPVDRINGYVNKETVEIPGGSRREISLAFQTLRAVDFDLVLSVRSSGVEKQLPIRVRIRPTYPIFGLVEHFSRRPPRTEGGNYADARVSLKAEEDMKYMRLLPCQIFRVDGPGCWATVEREKGEYFFDAADWHVAATRKYGGSKSLMLLGYEPGWAQPFFNPKEEEKLDHWRNYVRAVVRRYRDQVDYWEIWNEPYLFWFGGRGKRKKLYQSDYAEECSPILSAVITIASEVIRQEDPDGKILTPGFVPETKEAGTEPYRMLEKLFQMGMGNRVDFINLHIYPGRLRPLPLTGVAYRLDGKEVESWETAVRQWRRFDDRITTRDLLELMKKYGVEKPLWITEFGGHVATYERFQGLGILRQAAILVSEGTKGLHYYELYDYPHERGDPHQYQLIGRDDKYRTMGFIAYSQAIRYLTGASREPDRCEVHCLSGADEAYLPHRIFGRGKETIICLWSNAAKPADVEIHTKDAFASVHVSAFSPKGEFFTETSLAPGQKTDGRAIRITGDDQLMTRLSPLDFQIISLCTVDRTGQVPKP